MNGEDQHLRFNTLAPSAQPGPPWPRAKVRVPWVRVDRLARNTSRPEQTSFEATKEKWLAEAPVVEAQSPLVIVFCRAGIFLAFVRKLSSLLKLLDCSLTSSVHSSHVQKVIFSFSCPHRVAVHAAEPNMSNTRPGFGTEELQQCVLFKSRTVETDRYFGIAAIRRTSQNKKKKLGSVNFLNAGLTPTSSTGKFVGSRPIVIDHSLLRFATRDHLQ